MKFIADVMLGRLAKRLRLLGFDVLYDRAFTDNELIRLSLEQHRIILTRDTGLAERPLAANHLFIQSDHVDEQIHQVLDALKENPPPSPFSKGGRIGLIPPLTKGGEGGFASPKPLGPLTRCSLCNEPLTVIDKQEARDLVPQYVYERNDSFLRCGKCGRVYWKGTHVKRIISLPQK